MSNPALNNRMLEGERVLDSAPMTVLGAINKTFILLLTLLIPAVYTFSLVFSGYTDKAQMLTVGGAFAGLAHACRGGSAAKGARLRKKASRSSSAPRTSTFTGWDRSRENRPIMDFPSTT